MNQYKIIITLTAMIVGSSIILTGCGLKHNEPANNEQTAGEVTETPVEPIIKGDQPAVEEPETTKDPVTTEDPATDTKGDENSSSSNEDEAEDSSNPASTQPNYSLEETIEVNAKGLAVVTNASAITVIVNKQRNLPSTYEPKDLTVPNVPFTFKGKSPKKLMRKEAAHALEQLFAQAKKDKIELKAVSGYRAYGTQKAIFDRNAKLKGEAEANRTSAIPGQSEHQTGLAMDISSSSANYALEPSFGKTKEGKWLAKNAPKFGFVIRYLKGKEKITGYSYEPWHVRYVGKELAQEVSAKDLTLEEFFLNSVPVLNKK